MSDAYRKASKALFAIQNSSNKSSAQRTHSSSQSTSTSQQTSYKIQNQDQQERSRQTRASRRQGTIKSSGQSRRGPKNNGKRTRTNSTRREIILGQTLGWFKEPSLGRSKISPRSLTQIGGHVVKGRYVTKDDTQVGIVSQVSLRKPIARSGFTSSIKDGKGMFRGSEFLTTISSAAAGPSQGMTWWTVMLDPRVWYGTRVRNESLNWERFVLRNLTIEYTSTCPSTTAGSLMGAYSFDPENNISLLPGTTTFRIVSAYPEAELANVYNSCAWTWHNLPDAEIYYLQPQQGERFEYPGIFYLISGGTPTPATQMGNLMLHYEFEFDVPSVETSTVISDGTYASTYTNAAYNQATGSAFSLARASMSNPPSATMSYVGIFNTTSWTGSYTYKVPGEDYSIPISAGMVLYFRPNDAGTDYFVYLNPSSNTYDDRLIVDSSSGATSVSATITFIPLD